MKARFRYCQALDWDYIDDCPDPRPEGEHVCGLHGCAPVDPDGPQPNFIRGGGCGFMPKEQLIQLTFSIFK